MLSGPYATMLRDAPPRVHLGRVHSKPEKGAAAMSKKSSGSGKSPKPTPTYKSAVTGHFVSEHYAKTHPKTTYKQGKSK